MEDQSIRIELDLSDASQEALELMMDESADEGVFGEILSANSSKTPVLKLLYEHPRTPDDVRSKAARLLSVPAMQQQEIEEIRKADRERRERMAEQAKKESLMKKLQKLGVGERIKIAQTGNSQVRGVLLRDTNKLVVLTALGNPKITEPEVEAVARNRSVMEEALRVIAKNREWMKSYSIMNAIITNPKTPPALAMNYIRLLKKKDINLLGKNKGVSEAVRNMAQREVKRRQEKGA